MGLSTIISGCICAHFLWIIWIACRIASLTAPPRRDLLIYVPTAPLAARSLRHGRFRSQQSANPNTAARVSAWLISRTKSTLGRVGSLVFGSSAPSLGVTACMGQVSRRSLRSRSHGDLPSGSWRRQCVSRVAWTRVRPAPLHDWGHGSAKNASGNGSGTASSDAKAHTDGSLNRARPPTWSTQTSPIARSSVRISIILIRPIAIPISTSIRRRGYWRLKALRIFASRQGLSPDPTRNLPPRRLPDR
jgi:hypothetical protein